MQTNDRWREKPRIDYEDLFCVELNGHTSVADFGIATRSFVIARHFLKRKTESLTINYLHSVTTVINKLNKNSKNKELSLLEKASI